jgi:hypothetical protein
MNVTSLYTSISYDEGIEACGFYLAYKVFLLSNAMTDLEFNVALPLEYQLV